MSKRQILIVAALLVLVAAAGGAWWLLGPRGESGTAAASDGPNYVITSRDRALGNPRAKVVVIEYAAPSCPICAHFNSATFPQLKANYIDTGKVYYVFRLFPLRSEDGAVEKMARCLPEDKYFSFIDLMFRNQSKWDPDGYDIPDTHAALVQMGRIAGMSPEETDRCINDPRLDSTINQVAQDGESRYNITGTPTIVVNGVAQPSGFIPYDGLKQIIDTALAKS